MLRTKSDETRPCRPGVDHEDRLVRGRDRQKPPKVPDRLVAQDCLRNRRRADIDDPEVEEQRVRVLRRLGIVGSEDRPGKGCVHFGVRDREVPGDPLTDQRRPVERFGMVQVGQCRRRGLNALHLFARHLERGGKDRLMRDAHRGRRLGHAIEIDKVGARPGIAIRRADDQRLVDRMAAVLLEELVKRRLAQTRHEDRLVVRNQPRVDEGPLQVQKHEDVDRRSGKPRQRRHRAGFKDVARIGAARVQQAPHPHLVHRFAKRVGRNHERLDVAARQRLGGKRSGKDEPEQDQERAHAASLGRRHQSPPLDQSAGPRCRPVAPGPACDDLSRPYGVRPVTGGVSGVPVGACLARVRSALPARPAGGHAGDPA